MAAKTNTNTNTKKASPATKMPVNSFDEKLAKFAKRATASTEQNLGGKTIGTAGAKFHIDGQTTDEFEGIILDLANVKAYYSKPWDAKNPVPPDCYACNRDVKELVPHEQVKKPLAESCAGCRWNKFGTAPTGGGKMCKDTIRLHILRESDIADKFPEPYTLSVPPTSLKAFANYMANIEQVGLCPQVVKTTFRIEVLEGETFGRMSFDMGEQLDDEQASLMLDHAERVGDAILAPFPDKPTSEQPSAPAARSKVTGGKTSLPTTRRKK